MASLRDDDERLLAQIGYTQVRGSFIRGCRDPFLGGEDVPNHKEHSLDHENSKS